MQEGFEFGFYNSKEGSVREYDANQFGRMFDGVINDGVFSSIGDCFKVTSLEGLNILLGTGRAWYNHTWNEVIQPMQFKLDSSDAQYDRYDTIVLRINANELIRENMIYVKTGTPGNPPTPPALETDPDNKLWEYPLAVIKVTKLSTSVDSSKIVNLVGLDTIPPDMNLESYSNYIMHYGSVISENNIGTAKIVVHTSSSSNETAWMPVNNNAATYGYKKVFSNKDNIQNTCSIADDSIFNTDIFINPYNGSSLKPIKDIQDEEESFSYIYKYDVNDNDKQLILYSYYATKKDITIRFVGKGISTIS